MRYWTAFATFSTIVLAAGAARLDPLPRLNLDPAAVTVSGLSSGAFMAVQMHVAFSHSIAGAGVVAGGPYFCAENSVLKAITTCMEADPTPPDIQHLLATAMDFAEAGKIDPIGGLAGDRVYLFSGQADPTVLPAASAATADFYLAAGLAPDNLAHVDDIAAGHGFLAPGAPVPCGETDPPFLNDCGIDQAGDILSWLYGNLAPPASANADNLHRFDQTAFLRDTARHGLADEAFVYVPDSCAEGAVCRLHVAFHGCRQTTEDIGDLYPRTTGYNRWAETNGIVVLYPQIARSFTDGNPRGCWDWWGYDDADYATQNGPQIAAVAGMAAAIGVPLARQAPVCIRHDHLNTVQFLEHRAVFCGPLQLCVADSGDPIGANWERSVIFENAGGELSTTPCS